MSHLYPRAQSCWRHTDVMHPEGFPQQGPEQNGLQGEFLVLPHPCQGCGRSQHHCHERSRYCCRNTTGGVQPQGPPSLQQDGPLGLNFSIWKGEMESENHNSLTYLNSGAGEKHPTLHFRTIYCITSWYVTKYISGYSEDKNLWNGKYWWYCIMKRMAALRINTNQHIWEFLFCRLWKK